MVDRRVAQPTGLQLSSLAQPHLDRSYERAEQPLNPR